MIRATGGSEADVQQHRDAQRLRQQAWVARKRKGVEVGAGSTLAAWRAKKRHRKEAYNWIVKTDNQLVHATGYGLKRCAQPSSADRSDWSTWPLFAYTGDQGPVETAGLNFLQFETKLNLDALPDFAHGMWNDCQAALRSANLYAFQSLMLMLWNVRHGPWSEDVRFSEVQSVVETFLSSPDAQDSRTVSRN
jgi:hypothetical protein